MVSPFLRNVGLFRLYNRSRYMIYRCIQKVPWNYVIGMTVATPFIAIIQGTYLLHDYRRNHGDAPMPDVPSRGLVVVKRQSNNSKNKNDSLHHSQETPGITIQASPLKRFSTISTATNTNANTTVTNTILQTTIQNSQATRTTATAESTTAVNNDSHEQVQSSLHVVSSDGKVNRKGRSINEYHDDDDDANTMVTTNTRPLRILIIGDSLAAGVGTSRSSTPILPETIAQALSKALGGRAVLWTCFGVPGQTSSEIVHSIQHLDDIFVSTTKNHTTLLQRFNEWQMTQRQLAQSRIESAKRKTKEWIEHRNNVVVDGDNKNEFPTNSSSSTNNNTDDTVKSSNRVVRWWKRTRMQFQNDVQTLRTIFKRDDDENPTDDVNTVTNNLTIGGTTPMSLSEQAMMIGEYDIAIVLTGLNDLKESYLPFMRSHERTKELQQLHRHQVIENNNDDDREVVIPSFNDIMKGELIRILNALLDRRMHKRSSSPSTTSNQTSGDTAHPDQESHRVDSQIDLGNHNDHSSEQPQHRHHNKGPLIVFPALPYQPTILSQYPPLSWFMIPLLEMMDANKKMLSELYPGLVLFVESPDMHDWSNATLAQQGTVWEDFCVLFKLNDIAQDANERIIQLMKRHYDRWMIRDGDNNNYEVSTRHDNCTNDNDTTSSNDTDVDNMIHPLLSQSDDDCLYELDMMDNVIIRQSSPPSISLGSLMVAADGIHPSDIGYDMWGRHIADAIIKEWDKV